MAFIKRKLDLNPVQDRKVLSSDVTDQKTSINVLPVILVNGTQVYVNHWILCNVSTIVVKHMEQFKDLNDITPLNWGGTRKIWEFVMELGRSADIATIKFERERIEWANLFILLDRMDFKSSIKKDLFTAIINYPIYCNVNWTSLPYMYTKIIMDYTITLIKRYGPLSITFNMVGMAKKENLVKMINDLGLQRDIFNRMIELSSPPINFVLV